MWRDKLSFVGKRAIVTGGASGMGAAAVSTLCEQGAEVHVFDIKPPEPGGVSYQQVDMRDEASIDAAMIECDGPIDVLLNCAGMPQTFPDRDVVACNIAGLRHLTERVTRLMGPGGSVVSVSSAAAFRWERNKDLLTQLLETRTMSAALDWFDHQPDLGDPYVFSKMAVNMYTVRRAPQLAALGIRMNAISPGNTITAMTEDFIRVAGQDVLDAYSSVIGYPATPQHQADVMVFLASELASYVTGVVLNVDGGFLAAYATRQLPRARQAATSPAEE
jgi:NAD(P)-dependent dehydrogenase (short-subunit alcohol dehydrogenase family)